MAGCECLFSNPSVYQPACFAARFACHPFRLGLAASAPDRGFNNRESKLAMQASSADVRVLLNFSVVFPGVSEVILIYSKYS